MDLQTFYRQAYYLRNYPLQVTVAAPATITGSVTINHAKFLVLGRLAVGYVNVDFILATSPTQTVEFTAPTILPTSLNNLVCFTGSINDSAVLNSQSSGYSPTRSATKFSVSRYNVSNIVTGAVNIQGFFFYENGEPVV